LLAATPLLVAVAAALLTLRLYPVPVSGLVVALKRRPGLTGFLGAARSVRDPEGGLLPALAVVLGVSVAVFSTVISSTVTVGAETAAWEANGAQIRVSGARADDALVEEVAGVPGVAGVARVTAAAHTANLSGAVGATGVRVVIVDGPLGEVQRAAERLEPLPAELTADEVPVPVVTGGAVPEGTGLAELSGSGEVRVVGHVDTLPGYSTGQVFVVVTAAGWERLGGQYPTGNLALVSVAPGADREEVAEAVLDTVGAALVETPQERLDTYRSSPVTSGLTLVSIAAVVLATVLTALAIVLVQLISAPARARLLAILRTLGLRPGEGRRLTLWELGPLVVTATAVGGVVGVAVPWLVSQAVDLRAMTGGTRQPDLAIDPLLLGAAMGAVLVVVLAATLVAATVAGRSDITRHLRTVEER
jgi:putative ABC transport system permease protein